MESGLAPMSSRTMGPVAVIIWTASAGRSTPGRRPRRRIAAAMPAPVWPAVMTASASPRRTRSVATRIEESFFSRRARAGCSSIPTTCAAWTIETLAGSGPAMGPRGRLVTDEDEPVVGVGAGESQDAGHDLGGTVVAAHRVDRDADAVEPRLGWGGSRLRHRISARRRRRQA